jgi:hypothetical protein
VRESFAVRARVGERAAADDMLYLHCTMMLAQFQDDMPTVERQCITLLERGMDADPYLVGTYYTSLLYAEREQFKLLNFERYDARARDYFLLAGSRFVLVWHQSIAGPTRFLAGDTALAIETLRDGLDAAAAIGGRDSGLASIPALLLAEVHYERNELDAATELLDRHLARASELGFVDQLVGGFVTHSRLERLRGDVRAAERALGSAMDLAYTRGFARLRLNIVAEQMAHSLAAGDLDRVVRLAAVHDVRVPLETVLPKSGTTTGTEAHALAWVSLARGPPRGCASRSAGSASLSWPARGARRCGGVRSSHTSCSSAAMRSVPNARSGAPSRPRRPAVSCARCSTWAARFRYCSPRLPGARKRTTLRRPSGANYCGSRPVPRPAEHRATRSPWQRTRSPRANR